MIQIEIKGARAIQDALGEARAKLDKYASAALSEIAQEILDTPGVQRYPPASEANSPGRFNIKTRRPMGYYTRGRGAWYPIMRKTNLSGSSERASTAASRQRLQGRGAEFAVAGYKLRPTSQTLGKKWYIRKRGSMETVIGNATSYARYVNGREQATIMGRRGWTTLDDAAAQKHDDAHRIMDRWMGRLVNDAKL